MNEVAAPWCSLSPVLALLGSAVEIVSPLDRVKVPLPSSGGDPLFRRVATKKLFFQ